jgi:hypothetical protein
MNEGKKYHGLLGFSVWLRNDAHGWRVLIWITSVAIADGLVPADMSV